MELLSLSQVALTDESESGTQDKNLLLSASNHQNQKRSSLTAGELNLEMLTMQKNDVLQLVTITVMLNYST
jgi:hypothetical protein